MNPIVNLLLAKYEIPEGHTLKISMDRWPTTYSFSAELMEAGRVVETLSDLPVWEWKEMAETENERDKQKGIHWNRATIVVAADESYQSNFLWDQDWEDF